MATPANLTYANIETRVLNQLRLPTSENTKIAAIINQVYRDIYTAHDWWWLVKRSIITTSDDITTGTINVTNNSTTVTFSSAPTPSIAGRVLYVSGNTRDSGAVYRISTHVAGATAAALDAVYTGANDTAAGYNVWHDSYDLPADTGKLFSVKRFGYAWPLRLIGPQEMRTIKLYSTSVGKPEIASLDDFDTTGDPTTQRQLVVHPYPDNLYRMELHYKQQLNTELSSTTQPFIPDEFRQLIIYGALAQGFAVYRDDPTNSQMYQGFYQAALTKATQTHREYGEDYPRFSVRDDYSRFYRRGQRPRAATADLGEFFDRWPVDPAY